MSLQVIGAGNGRTGTLTTKLALEQLGFGPCYHMLELMSEPERVGHWQDAFAGRPVDWPALFDGYRSTTDYPGFYFWSDLMQAFPDAKVVLTTRPAADWYESAKSTIYTAPPGPLEKLRILTRLPFSPYLRSMLPVFKIADRLFTDIFEGRFEDRDFAIAKYEEMNQAVIDGVPPERLLVYNVADGWGPLCEFLGVETPDGPMPHAHRRADFPDMIASIKAGSPPTHHRQRD
ncbi:MAG: sulfotransferase family protein [Actinomycetota bacterium]